MGVEYRVCGGKEKKTVFLPLSQRNLCEIWALRKQGLQTWRHPKLIPCFLRQSNRIEAELDLLRRFRGRLHLKGEGSGSISPGSPKGASSWSPGIRWQRIMETHSNKEWEGSDLGDSTQGKLTSFMEHILTWGVGPYPRLSYFLAMCPGTVSSPPWTVFCL